MDNEYKAENLPESKTFEELEEGDAVDLDDIDLMQRAEMQYSEEELREANILTLEDAEGRKRHFLPMANLMVVHDQYLIVEDLDEGEEGHYQILPYELGQSEDEPILFRDFRDEAEFLLAQEAAQDMFDSGMEEEN